MAQDHPPFIADAAGSAGVSTKPAAGGAPPKDLVASKNDRPTAPAGTLPDELFPNPTQQARPKGKAHVSPDPASVVGGAPFKDSPPPAQATARPLSMPKPFSLKG